MTNAEKVLDLYLAGFEISEIAAQLGLSIEDVRAVLEPERARAAPLPASAAVVPPAPEASTETRGRDPGVRVTIYSDTCAGITPRARRF